MMWELSDIIGLYHVAMDLFLPSNSSRGFLVLVLGLRGWPLASLRWKILLVNL